MRFISGSICVLLGLFVVGGAHPARRRGTGSSAASTRGAASSSAVSELSRVLNEQEILDPVDFLTKFSTFKVHSGGVLEGISTQGVEIDEMTKRPNGICEGPWVKINLMPAAWPDSVKQLPSPPSPSVSATPYAQSTILLLLQQSGVLSLALWMTGINEGCVHFTFNLHDAEASIPIVHGIGAQVSIYSANDECLAVSIAHIKPVALGKTRPSATLTASSHSHRMSIEKFEGELSLEPAGVKGAIKQCCKFLKSAFSGARRARNELPTQGQLPSQGHHSYYTPT
ncbi:hypothetical protein FB446DRAFT_503762 [Lentinula raphanica]|nr:hypothetical protein FB446DRAFT_503762 [Lentinula raphanica]